MTRPFDPCLPRPPQGCAQAGPCVLCARPKKQSCHWETDTTVLPWSTWSLLTCWCPGAVFVWPDAECLWMFCYSWLMSSSVILPYFLWLYSFCAFSSLLLKFLGKKIFFNTWCGVGCWCHSPVQPLIRSVEIPILVLIWSFWSWIVQKY